MLTIAEARDVSPAGLAALSRAWDAVDGARLVVAVPDATATVLGAFERQTTAGSFVRRGSGGAPVTIGPGTIWLQLALERPDALVACRADQVLNRYVRPVLRAIGKVSRVPASYFGRDWISLGGHPVGLVSFAHDAGTNRCLFEAILAVSTPFSAPRASFREKAPATIDAPPDRLAALLREAFGPGAPASTSAQAEAMAIEPPWTATVEEALGIVGADRARLGGELVASRDAVADVAQRLAEGASLDTALAAFAGAQLFGARIEALREVLGRAGAKA